MQSSSPLLHYPSTPLPAHNQSYPTLGYTYRPLNSSPLASPSSRSSPVAAAQARRRSQYKSRTPSTPVASSSRVLLTPRPASGSGGLLFISGRTSTPEDSQKVFLREKFRTRCIERAAKARAKAIKGRRYAGSEPSSDGFDETMDEDDEDEGDDDIMQDELFRRIIERSNGKSRHSYRLSYAWEVGSSFDPDMEDISTWEHELAEAGGSNPISPYQSTSQMSVSTTSLTPEDLDDEELAAYAEECTKRAALADFEDIPEEDLFSWSDMEDFDEAAYQDGQGGDADAMDMTY